MLLNIFNTPAQGWRPVKWTGKEFLSPAVLAACGVNPRENAMAGKSSTKSKKPSHEAFVVTGEGETTAEFIQGANKALKAALLL